MALIYAAVLDASVVAPAWAAVHLKNKPTDKKPAYYEKEMPSFTFDDVKAGFALDPRKKLGKALSGNTLTKYHAAKKFEFKEVK